MKYTMLSVKRRALALLFGIGLAPVAGWIFLHSLVSPAMAQTQNVPMQHATPWTPAAPVIKPHIGTPTIPALGPSVTFNSRRWTPIGPAPLDSSSVNGNVSGRITGIAAHPTNANTIYIASAGGGVWKTTDGGTSWSGLTDRQRTLSMGAIAIGTDNPDVVYAGTGEANNSGDSNYGRGILISSDAGATWTLSTGPSDAFDRLTTSQIAIDPTDTRVAYAAMADRGINGLSGNTGIWKTIDRGTNWINTTASIDSTDPWSAVVIDANNTQTIYASVGNPNGAGANGVYKSTNGGTSWALLTNAPRGLAAGRIAIAVSNSNPEILYVTASGTGMTGSTSFGTLYRIMRSDNAGNTFTDLTGGTPNFMGAQGWYDTYVVVDPSDSAAVYVGGAAGTNSILRSTNSGVAWSDLSGGLPAPHADHHAAAFDPTGKLLDGNDGGIYRLDIPALPSWTNLNGNLETIQFYGIGLHPTDPNKAIGGSQDNGTELFTGSLVWTETDGGDGGFAKFSSTNGSRAYHQIPVPSFGPNFFRRSDDGGMTWSTKTSGIVAEQGNQNFVAPFDVDPANGDRILYGTKNVWESIDGGDTWTRLSSVGSNGWNPAGDSCNISNPIFCVDAIGLAPSNVNTIYAATGGTFATSSQIFVTTDHGATWTEHDLPAGNGRVNDIQVDPRNDHIAYAVVNRFGGGHVFRTADGGTTWTNISGNLPDEPVWSLQIGSPRGGKEEREVEARGQEDEDKENDEGTKRNKKPILYVGADDGVYVTTEGGTCWHRFGEGFPKVQVFQLELNRNLHILGAGTHGRGMWEIKVGKERGGRIGERSCDIK
jgi:photosystem II stability/assembly factor-like uncharacterized protein